MKNRIIAASTIAAALMLASPATAEHHCAHLPDLMLIVKRNELRLNDNRPVCVTVPGKFVIKIHNPPGSGHDVGPGDATARGKLDGTEPPPSATMAGNNSDNEALLAVDVSGSANIGDEFKFWISVEGVGTLDPTVRVIGNQERDILTYQWAVESLEVLSLDRELIEQILRPLLPQD